LDAVLLAAAAPVMAGKQERILDSGAGAGVVGLAIARRVPDARVTLVERDGTLLEMARRNAARNGLSDRVEVVAADIARPMQALPRLAAQAESYDHVVVNPPYNPDDTSTAPPDPLKAGSHTMPAGGLERWAKFAATMARPGGVVTIIHRADALGYVLAALSGRFGGIVIFPLFPRPGEPAKRVIVQGRKGSRAALTILAGLTLHTQHNSFRPEVEAILRCGAALELTS
jgi:tRNA1(Val) A37 N6-methylase TrmN6